MEAKFKQVPEEHTKYEEISRESLPLGHERVCIWDIWRTVCMWPLWGHGLNSTWVRLEQWGQSHLGDVWVLCYVAGSGTRRLLKWCLALWLTRTESMPELLCLQVLRAKEKWVTILLLFLLSDILKMLIWLSTLIQVTVQYAIFKGYFPFMIV